MPKFKLHQFNLIEERYTDGTPNSEHGTQTSKTLKQTFFPLIQK